MNCQVNASLMQMPRALQFSHHIQISGKCQGSMPIGTCPGCKSELNLSPTEPEHWMCSVQDDFLLLAHLVSQRSLLINAALVAQKSYTDDNSLLEKFPLR